MKIKMSYSDGQLARTLVDLGEFVRKGGEYYEDMGGHIIHESAAQEYFTHYLNHCSLDERKEIFKMLSED